ncbi:uncharacterized protein V6R79_002685 [Siganus canaliculatus]
MDFRRLPGAACMVRLLRATFLLRRIRFPPLEFTFSLNVTVPSGNAAHLSDHRVLNRPYLQLELHPTR